MLNDKRVRIIIGHYGSGKTEFAVNYALKLSKEGKKVALADLDVVNPYFRSRDKHGILKEYGIKVESSFIQGSGTDLPAISAGVLGPIQDESYDYIMDVGGNSAGARTLGRYHEHLAKTDYDMFCVVNANRPETQTVEGTIHHIKSIEKTSRVKVTGLINNTHMLRYTTTEDVLKGQELCREVSKELDLPIKYVSTLESIAKKLPNDLEGEIVSIDMIMREDWM